MTNEVAAATLYTKGQSLRSQGKLADALRCFVEAVAQDGSVPNYYVAFALALADLKQLAQACEVLKMATGIHPQSPELLSSLGNLLGQAGRHEEAVAHHRRAVALLPSHPEIVTNLGVALLGWKKFDEAHEVAKEALALSPERAELQYNVGTVLLKMQRPDDAEPYFRKTLDLDPKHVNCRVNLGTIAKARGRIAEARTWFAEAIALDPQHADAHWNLALALLSEGNYRDGWREYEWRKKIPAIASRMRLLPKPEWDGQPFDGKTLLITAEQGLGDTIQFIRFAKLARERGGKVIVQCPPGLRRLLSSASGIDEITAGGPTISEVDFFVPLLSLPRIFASQPFPAPTSYLAAETGLAEHFRAKLRRPNRIQVGICWQGNPNYEADAARSIPLRHFETLFDIPNIDFFGFQKEHGIDQVASLSEKHRAQFVNLGEDFDKGQDAFVETAAAMKAMDLMICSDTSIPHLSAALGCETWLLIPHRPDWRWEPCTDRTVFYPTMRVFRQPRPGDWAGVFSSAEGELRKLGAAVRS